MENIFEVLNAINVNEHTDKKGGLTYLSWAWAWAEVKKNYPLANYKVYENENQYNYFNDGMTAWVKVGAIINDLEHIEYLPIMDFRNKSIVLDKITSFDVNKAIQRGLTKAFARHGLGLYIYAGEDLPQEEQEQAKEERKPALTTTQFDSAKKGTETQIKTVLNKFRMSSDQRTELEKLINK